MHGLDLISVGLVAFYALNGYLLLQRAGLSR